MTPLTLLKSGTGAFSSLTEEGLPERMIPFTVWSALFSELKGHISQYTLSSLTLRAMSWVYWDPKSKIMIFSSTKDMVDEIVFKYTLFMPLIQFVAG